MGRPSGYAAGKRAAGLCIWYRCVVPASSGVYCLAHAEWQRAKSARLQAGRRARGLCLKCDAQPDTGRSLCFRHLAMLRKSGIRQAAIRRAVNGRATAAQIEARVAFYGGRCAYCPGPYEHLDHVIPVALGGSGWPANLRPACAKCNMSKHDKRLAEWRAGNLIE